MKKRIKLTIVCFSALLALPTFASSQNVTFELVCIDERGADSYPNKASFDSMAKAMKRP